MTISIEGRIGFFFFSTLDLVFHHPGYYKTPVSCNSSGSTCVVLCKFSCFGDLNLSSVMNVYILKQVTNYALFEVD